MRAPKQSASALISALFIVAVVAMLAVAMLYTQRLFVDRAILIKNYDQMTALMPSAMDWAHAMIQAETSKTNITPTLHPQITFHDKQTGIALQADIIDQQGLYNINARTGWRFMQLMQTLFPKMTRGKVWAISMRIERWVAASQDDDLYARLRPPYGIPHQPFFDKSELRTVIDISQSRYQQLAPYITALAHQATLNINTASYPVMMTLFKNITADKAHNIIACRNAHGWFYHLDNFKKLCLLTMKLDKTTTTSMTTVSQFFIIRVHAQIGQQQLTIDKLVKANLQNNQLRLQVLWQT